MTFRRVIFEGENINKLEEEIKTYTQRVSFKINYPLLDIKIIKPPHKDNVLVVDIWGEGADTISKKLKNIGEKYRFKITIKHQKTFVKK